MAYVTNYGKSYRKYTRKPVYKRKYVNARYKKPMYVKKRLRRR